MVGQERWQEVHRLFREARVPIAEISRRLDLDRKTVRRCLRRGIPWPLTRLAQSSPGVDIPFPEEEEAMAGRRYEVADVRATKHFSPARWIWRITTDQGA